MGPEIPGYRIDALVGRGGMGVVYRAEHLHLQRTVALKVLVPELADDPGFRERFIRESRIAAGIDHPGIVTVYDAGEADGLLYIAMRYVEGTDLATLLAGTGSLAPDLALALLEQVASALDAAHARGLVHRDVKPANVLIQDERCYLTDFGLTKRTTAATALTATGQFVGTIAYVAPEQIRGGDLGPQTDVYALACVLFECLAGAPPFRRDSDVATLYAHLEEPPPRVTERRTGLPGRIDEVLASALAKKPAERPPSCGALIAAVREALREAPAEPTRPAAAPTTPARPAAASTTPAAAPPTGATRALPSSVSAPEPRESRRWPIAAGAAAAASVALAVVLVLAFGGGGEEAPPPPPPTAGEDLTGERVEVGREPVGVAAREGLVWVTNSGDGTVSVVDEGGDVRGEPLRAGGAPFGVTVGGGLVWVANSGDGTVSRLDAETGEPRGDPVQVGVSPRAIAMGIGNVSVWVANAGDGTVSRIDVDTGSVLATVRVGDEPSAVATTPSSVWVANSGDGTLTRIDPRNNAVDEPVQVGSGPRALAIKDGVMWVVNADDGTVSRLDNSDGSALGPAIEVGGRPVGVAAGDRFIWVTNEADGTVVRLDPDDGRVVGQPLRVAEHPAGVRASGGFVWIADRDGGTLVRLRERP